MATRMRVVTTAIDYLALAALAVAVVIGSVAATTGRPGLGIAIVVIGLLGIVLKISLIRLKAKARTR